MSVDVFHPSVDDCHFATFPKLPVRVMVAVFPGHMMVGKAEVDPPTDTSSTVTLITFDPAALLQSLLQVTRAKRLNQVDWLMGAEV